MEDLFLLPIPCADACLPVQVFDDMQARGVLADVVTCCSLINALERGGQWQLAEQLFVQMCAASWQSQGVNSPLYRIMEIAAAPALEVTQLSLTEPSSSPHPAVAWDGSSMSSPMDKSVSTDSVGGSQHRVPWTPAEIHGTEVSPEGKTREATYMSSPKAVSSPDEVQSSLSSSPSSMPSPGDKSAGMLSHTLARSDKQAPLNSCNDVLTPHTRSTRNLCFSQDSATIIGRSTSGGVTQTTLGLHHVGSFQSANSSSSISCSPSDYTPKYLEQSPSLEHARSGVGLVSPARTPYTVYSQDLTGQSSISSDLVQSFSDMHVGNTAPSVRRSLFPPEQPGQSSGFNAPCSLSGECSDTTVRRIQEAAANRQEMLSLRPVTNPVGGSMGQAPVLRHMNVSQIAPNRVCCNALLAAYARARPTLWQKVDLQPMLPIAQSAEAAAQ